MTTDHPQPPNARLSPGTRWSAPFVADKLPVHPSWLARWAWLLVPLLMVAIAVVYALDLQAQHESPTLLTAFNTLFIVSSSFVISYLAAGSYLATGSRSLLSFGTGALIFGIAYLVAGPLVSTPNESITLHNIAVLAAGALFVLSALWATARNPPHTPASRDRRAAVVSTYIGAFFFMGLVVWAAVAGLFPDFYVKGQGLTVVRQAVLGLGVIELLMAAGLFGLLCRRLRSDFLLWCSSGVAMVGVALGAALLTAAVSGSPLAWVERSGQWIGGAFLFVAISGLEPRGGAWIWPLERALREGEERLQIALDSAQLGTFDFDPITRTLGWDEQTKRMCGVPLTAQVDCVQAMELIHPDDRKQVEEALAAAFDPGGAGVYEVEHRIVRPDGSVRWNHAKGRAYFDGEGNQRRAVHLTGVNYDITDLKQTENALRRSEEEFRGLVDSSLDIVWVTDVEGGISFVNRTYLDFFGVSLEDVMRVGWQPLVHPEDRVAYVGDFLRALRERLPFRAEARVRRADGEWRWLDSHGGPRFSKSGEYLGHIGMSPDITERKTAEEDLRKSEEQLRQSQKMEAVGQLAGGIAHDFNNLLTAILGYSDMILASKALSLDEVRADVEEIKQAGERASALTRQILAFSRRQALRPQVVLLDEVVRGIEPLLRRSIGENINLQIAECPGGLAPVDVDPHQFEQVVMNLVLNARDAMPSGGRLTVEITNAELDAEFSATHDRVTPGSYVMLRISDTGVGMDAHVKEHLFEPFFTTKAFGAGTGLGLATVYGIVKQSQGSIFIDSEMGKGTTVDIYLPCAVQPAVPEEILIESHASGRGHETIMVVEDEEALRGLLQRILGAAGYATLIFSSAQEALAALEEGEHVVDMLLTDVMLPGPIQGHDLARTVLAARPHLPVLYVSGYSRDALIHAGRLDEGVNLLEKPFTLGTLTHAVREVLDMPRETG